MPTLLQLDSSADTRHSSTRSLAAAFADAWRERGADHTVVVRDLHRDPLPHLPDAALHWPERLRPADAEIPAGAADRQRALLDELLAADVLLVGAPMYNYAMPSSLKAWIDHIHVPGVTASFDVEAQPLAGRPAIIISSRGAGYDIGTPTEGWDHVIPPLRLILGTALGMDVTAVTNSFTLAETTELLSDHRERARREFDAARAELVELARRV